MAAPAPVTVAGATRWYSRRPAAWVHPAFRRLTLAWVFTNLADSALYLMVAVWVKELTGSDGAAAMVFVMLGLPAVAAPVLGQVADRLSRRRLLIGSNVLVTVVVATLLLVDSASWLWLLYAVVVAYGAMGYLSAAAQAGLLRDILPDEHLASGNGLLTSVDQSLRLVSPVLGTGLYALAGPRAVVLVTAACFLLTALALVTVRVVESAPEAAADRGSYLHEVSAGFRHLARTPLLGRLTLLLAVVCAATGLVNAAVFPALEQGLGLPASALGALVGMQGIGAVTGGLTAAWVIGRWGESRVFAVGAALMALGIAPVVGSSVALVVTGLVVLGLGVTWSVVAFMVIRQRLTPPRLQGRTNAAANVAVNLPQTATTAMAAALLVVVDYRLLVVVTVAATALAALAAAGPRLRSRPAR
ncbi:MFS transporter [Ornithinimicrobium pekingense]|uniref:MFS transporter n=1 Tax=Ornithinimicrobium pekingense TaxID=384677 RepID=A0ABQ2F852_9MICO|nr:MFS transporter [Ornithinimicrobium pekingense]GGK70820.1 MFS transporter [Ornithinimicrobium pekingense]